MQNKSHKSFRLQQFHESGFTLIEVMVSLAVLGILAALAAPSFSDAIKKYRVKAIKDDLIASMQMARTEAIRRGKAVGLIREIAAADCTVNGASWNCGWRIVIDASGDRAIDSTERNDPANILKVTTIPPGYNVTHTGDTNQMIYNVWGQATGVGQSFVISNSADGSTGAATMTVCISAGGRIRSVKGATC
jgi:type IV fimbrial biogenesis protein FimT